MGKQLGQGDIDALFAAAGENSSAQAAGLVSEVVLEQYDFSREGQISNDQMRAISSVNDLFARNLMHTLGAWLRTPFKMKLVAGEQLPFSEFLERLSSPSYVCSIRLEPLGAVGLLELELALASPIVDVLLGGVGRALADAGANRHRGIYFDVGSANGSAGVEPGLASGWVGVCL